MGEKITELERITRVACAAACKEDFAIAGKVRECRVLTDFAHCDDNCLMPMIAGAAVRAVIEAMKVVSEDQIAAALKVLKESGMIEYPNEPTGADGLILVDTYRAMLDSLLSSDKEG